MSKIGIGMRCPVVDFPDILYPMLGVGLPSICIGEKLIEDIRDGLVVRDVNQDTAVAVLLDVLYSSLVGSDKGQSNSGGFDEGEAEVLQCCCADKDAALHGSQSVEFGNIAFGIMMLGNSHLAVQVVAVHQEEHIGEDLLLSLFHGGDVIADSSHNYQIGYGLQLLALAIDFDEQVDVFPGFGAAKGQDERLFCSGEKALQLPAHGILGAFHLFGDRWILDLIVVVRKECLQVESWGYHLHFLFVP
ncbi:hypothetical protein SDC9_64790 [bioreactor metagenome]|uniref:Uncharacterized protein n=1 Tax=bioreactor metagenome TaxID=1076179 RepID=A0A644XRH8_9ZZZZ